MKQIIALITLLLLTVGCAQAKPPRPGPNYVWVPKHIKQNGVVIKGHWKHKSKIKKQRVWVPAHIKPNGRKVPGHWVY